jgi:4-oxalocrotonate tautomerase
VLPIVTVQQSPCGLEPKRRLVAGITQAFVDAYGVRPEHVQLFIHEVDHENWAKEGSSRSTPSGSHEAARPAALRPRPRRPGERETRRPVDHAKEAGISAALDRRAYLALGRPALGDVP